MIFLCNYCSGVHLLFLAQNIMFSLFQFFWIILFFQILKISLYNSCFRWSPAYCVYIWYLNYYSKALILFLYYLLKFPSIHCGTSMLTPIYICSSLSTSHLHSTFLKNYHSIFPLLYFHSIIFDICHFIYVPVNMSPPFPIFLNALL